MSKFCPECGAKQHDDNNRYCSNCGFDFSKLGDIAKSDGDDSSSKTSFGSTKPKISQNSTNKPNQSSSQRTEVNHDSTANTKNNNGLGFLSNLSFNKCFFAFAALLILLVIVGMVSNVNQEPCRCCKVRHKNFSLSVKH